MNLPISSSFFALLIFVSSNLKTYFFLPSTCFASLVYNSFDLRSPAGIRDFGFPVASV
jgi:hypothetical protein